MNEIKKYIKFFFQVERIHPLHGVAFICFMITLMTLPFEIVYSIIQNVDSFSMVLRVVMFICMIVMSIGVYQAYQKSQKNN